MTDNEIVKALECCAGKDGRCEDCPYEECFTDDKNFLLEDALDLINRQKAEIERLQKDNEYILMQHRFQRRPGGDCWNDVIEKAKAEAIKEFAERLKEQPIKYRLPLLWLRTKDEIEEYVNGIMMQVCEAIDKLVKEMAEGNSNAE